MALYCFIYRVVLIIICKFLTQSSTAAATLPSPTSGVFYELASKEGYKYSYRDGPLVWSNLKISFDENGEKKKEISPGLLCITGVWLVYPHPGYRTSNEDVVNLISGNDKCINPSELGTIGAMQPLKVESDSSITLFSKTNFGSLAQTFSKRETKMKGVMQLRQGTGLIGSLVVIGVTPWSLISSSGKVLCVRPRPSEQIRGLSICHGADITQIIEYFHVNAIYPDCPEEHDASAVVDLKLPDCKEFGSDVAEALKNKAIMRRSVDNSLECAYNITWNSLKFTEEESTLIARLLTIRLTHDFTSTEQILWPDAREDIWKTGPIDTAFDIVFATVPDHVVNNKFMMMVQEFTVFHLNEVWKEQREKGDKIGSLNSWRSHKVLVYLLNKCLLHASKTRNNYAEVIKRSYNQRSNLEDFNSTINPSLVLNPNYDPIIEIAWVVSNYAMALCHSLFEYKINFWDNFITTFEYLYFRPLENRWKNPTIISPKTWGVIMSGFGIESQHRRMAFATSRMLELTPKMEPLEKIFTFYES